MQKNPLIYGEDYTITPFTPKHPRDPHQKTNPEETGHATLTLTPKTIQTWLKSPPIKRRKTR